MSDFTSGPADGVFSAEITDGRLHLYLNNSLAALVGGRQWIEAYFKPKALDPLLFNRIEVVFEEAVANVIRHGFRPRSDQLLFVRARDKAKIIELAFEDEGVPFDPAAAPLPEAPSSLDATNIGGLGLTLLRKLSSQVRYERIEKGKSIRRVRDRDFAPVNRLILTLAK